jgi:hypothetical protein
MPLYPPAEESRALMEEAGWSVSAAPHPVTGWRVRGTHRFGRLEFAGRTEAAAWWHALLLAHAMLLGPAWED